MGIFRSALSRVNVFRELEKDGKLVLSLLYDRRKPHITVFASGNAEMHARILQHPERREDELCISLFEHSSHYPRLSIVPDVVLAVAEQPSELLRALRGIVDANPGANMALIGAIRIDAEHSLEFPKLEAECRNLAQSDASLDERIKDALKTAIPVTTPAGDSPELAERVLAALPEQAWLEGARMLRVSAGARRDLANRLVEACAELATTVGLSPVPFSDAVLLAPIQGAMITGVAFLAGEPLHVKSVGKWAGSLGVAGAVAYGFRYGAQSLVKAIPGAGSVISGGVAGAGTLAMGKSAIRFYLGE